MLYSVSLAEKLGDKGVQSFSLYPGRIFTGIVKHLSTEDFLKAGMSLTWLFDSSLYSQRSFNYSNRATDGVWNQAGSIPMAVSTIPQAWLGEHQPKVQPDWLSQHMTQQLPVGHPGLCGCSQARSMLALCHGHHQQEFLWRYTCLLAAYVTTGQETSKESKRMSYRMMPNRFPWSNLWFFMSG